MSMSRMSSVSGASASVSSVSQAAASASQSRAAGHMAVGGVKGAGLLGAVGIVMAAWL